MEYQTRLTDGEVECETDMYGCDANYINSAGEVASVAASASDIVGTNGVFNNLNLLDKVGSEGDCGSSKMRRRRQKRGGGGARMKGGAYNSGYTSNIPKKRPLLKGSKMVDKRTKVGKAALIKRDNLSVRELAAKAALARFGNAPTTTSVATASSTNIGASSSATATVDTTLSLSDSSEHDDIGLASNSNDMSDSDDDDDSIVNDHTIGCGCRCCEWSKLF